MSIFQSNSYFAGFYWGPRQEDVKKCAARLKSFLDRVAAVDPALQGWRIVEDNFSGKRLRLRTSKNAIEELVAKEWMRKEIGHELVPDGGCRLMLANVPVGSDQTTVSVGCGAWSKWLRNACVIYLPSVGAVADRMLRVAVMIELGKACVESWEPDSGVVVTHDLLEAVEPERKSETMPRVAEFGWLTYLSAAAYESRGTISPPSYVVPIGALGHIIVAMDEQPDPSNRTHVKILSDVLKHIRRIPMVKKIERRRT